MTEANNQPLNVLFLGGRNAVRSIMAEAILNHEGMGRYRAFSAGREPGGKVHPATLDLLSKLSFDISGLHSKSWLEFVGPDAAPLDFVFTVCDGADDAACAWPGNPVTGHWGLPDPAAVRGKDPEMRLAFADAFRMLNNRIVIFTSLPIRSLDQLSLRRQLDLIARRNDSFKSAAAAAA
jgi:arsenate reductase (thioredoxin)